MTAYIVVNNPARWPLEIPDVEVVSAKAFLTDPKYSKATGAKVFNLCRHYSYQSQGYYVSMLAEARGQRPMPDVATIFNMRSVAFPRALGQDLTEEMQHALAKLKSSTFTLSIYFGRNMAKRYDRLALLLFNLFPAPLLRAEFVRKGDRWQLENVGPVPVSEIADSHRAFAVEAATEYLGKKRHSGPRRSKARYDLAILYDKAEEYGPSDDKAIRKFMEIAGEAGFRCEIIGKFDYGRLAEFDALFIRETTSVNHHTYRFARRAAHLGLAVIDDPLSILKCTNKVYLAELLARHNLPAPRTVIVHEDNVDEVARELGVPCVLKRPDGAFSQGVMKATDEKDVGRIIERMFEDSDLVIAQEWLPTQFDWRVGVLDRKPLYVCRYFMAHSHWQIANHAAKGGTSFGKVETLLVEEAPPEIIKAAVKAANLIGDGLYGVDLKEVDGKPHIIEINDNPNLNSGYEDARLKDELWRRLAWVFLTRVQQSRDGALRT